MRAPVVLVALVAAASLAVPPSVPAQGEEPVAEHMLDAEHASNLVLGPDGTLYFSEVWSGNVSALRPGSTTPEFLFHIDVIRGPETGLTGLALAPDFEETGAFYVYAVVPVEGKEHGENRLLRIVPGEEPETLLTVPAAKHHNGGRILWGPDGHLFIGTGENNEWGLSQDEDDPRGKVLRVTADGEPAPGNPFDNEVYTLGHRNVYGLAYDPERNLLVATENGMDTADEMNVLELGNNYGWWHCEGPCEEPNPEYTDPTLHWGPPIAPTGITHWRGHFWMGDFNQGGIHKITPPDEPDGNWTDEIVHTHEDALILDIEPGPEGNTLWFSTWHGIQRLTFPNVEPNPIGNDDGDNLDEDDGEANFEPPKGPAPTPGPALAAILVALTAATRTRRSR